MTSAARWRAQGRWQLSGPTLPAGRHCARLLDRLPELETVGESMWSSEGLDAVIRGDIAAAVVRGPVKHAALHSTSIGSYHDGFVALAEHDRLATQEKVSVQAFQGRPILITERPLAEAVHDRTVAFFTGHGWPRVGATTGCWGTSRSARSSQPATPPP
jgi:hypothetical protein